MARKKSTDALFISMAPAIMRLLMQDFAPLTVEDAGAALGNLGHESGGFKFLQEKKPLVPGSRGGFGWGQWTGPRRRAFEAFLHETGFDPASADANYGYLKRELKGTERATIPAVRAAGTLEEKVIAFEMHFERASPKYKHYPERVAWAHKAIAAYNANPHATVSLAPAAPPVVVRQPDPDEEIAAGFITDRQRVKAVQQSLVDFGYPPGGIDGRIGALTVAALAAYRHDRGLPVSDKIDAALISDMMTADGEEWKRPVSVERATAPRAEIVAKSRTLQVSSWGKIIAALGLGSGAAGQSVKGLLDPDSVDSHLSIAQRVIDFAGANWPLLVGVAAAGVVAYGALRLIDHFKVQDYRLGVRP